MRYSLTPILILPAVAAAFAFGIYLLPNSYSWFEGMVLVVGAVLVTTIFHALRGWSLEERLQELEAAVNKMRESDESRV